MKRGHLAPALALAALAALGWAMPVAAQVEVESELVALPEALDAAREALLADRLRPRNSIGLSGSLQGDRSARFGLDANAALEYRRSITRALSVGLALPADVTTGDRRGVRLILEDPDLSLGLRLFAVRVNGRPVAILGAGAAYGIRVGEPNPVRIEGGVSVPIPTRPWWAIDVALGRQFRVGGRYATLGIARAF